ncbi:MAG TPA: 50S ribosomal protein L17 [Spirochaetia bacterium]|nr:50S ribosomal protein L17 [Spirochaetia bacterium]
MKHRIGFNRLGRNASHRKALHRNMVTSLFKYERIETTKAKALSVRRKAEKMVTRAKEDSVHNRRIIAKSIKDEAVLAKLFKEIGPRYKDRNGGYTRILKLGQRSGDAAEVVILELVDRKVKEKKKKEKVKKEAAKDEKTKENTEVEPPAEEANA